MTEAVVLILSLLAFGAAAYDYDYCSYPLLDRAQLKASSSLPERGPSNARLYGPNAWTAHSSDFSQYLTIDLGQTMNITAISTQGRANNNEYVMEYGISYGTNGLDYVDFKDSDGSVKMFTGNKNGSSVEHNMFEVPIIAQWVRINPTRWRNRISMRVELYGCDYVSNILSFNGSSLVSWNLHREIYRHSMRFRFKTNNADGVMMYSRGSQGDFFALQLRDNRMLLNIDLGSGIMTSFSVGSLLDDNMWHDVGFSRNHNEVKFSVDRVFIDGRIKGEFHRLDLNREFYIGGVPNKQQGLVVNQNFTGCIENLFFNYTNMIKEIQEANDEKWRYQLVHTSYSCPEPPIISVTFLTSSSYAKLKGYEGLFSMNISLSFRTYEGQGIIFYHDFISSGYVKMFLEEGKLKVELKTKSDEQKAILDNFDETFNDGKWHQIVFTMAKNSLTINIDSRPTKTTRQMDIATGHMYFVGGMPGNQRGFIGCMRVIQIDGNYQLPTDWKEDQYCCKHEIVFDACQMVDRCNPNPCEHSGICMQNSDEFFCDCSKTGYSGAVCHTSLNPLSCTDYRKSPTSVNQKAEITIDVDGSGPLRPFPVTCEYFAGERVITVLRHSNEKPTTVKGFEAPGSFSQDIHYEAEHDQIEALIGRSDNCRQHLSYFCKHSHLFNSPSNLNEPFQPNSWWVGRNNQKMDYWGGALPGSRKCECGILGNCAQPEKWCNCDADLEGWFEDAGEIAEKDHLPVKQLRFGNTGTSLDEKEGRYTLGPLVCEGDDFSQNVVTFRIVDATINLPTFEIGHSGDIYFEFKTTQDNAVIIHSKGSSDYIKISINGGNQIHFQYQAGGSPLAVSVQTSSRLADDNWHSVSVERNRKEARIVIDGAFKNEVREPPGPVRALQLDSSLVVGATTEFRDGYVGCIRSLLINGKLQDLRSHARRGLYGVSEGCEGRCKSSPCLNNGTCHERYDGYWCDCRWTAFKGPICADEIGINLRQNSMVKYDFSGSWRSTISESIRVGFTTTNPKGFLLGFTSNITGEYMTIMVSNSGHLRVVFDFGFERQEIIYPDKHFGLGQYHDVHIGRKNGGSTLVIKVDNQEPKEFNFAIKGSADAQFNNIQYMYIGRNESMTEGFIGCVSRVEFDDIYPLKLLFQENGPGNVRSIGSRLTEDYCGVEPITHPPNSIETRPPPEIDENKVRDAYGEPDAAVLGGVLAVMLIALCIMMFLIGRYISRHKGEYLTQEDKGAEVALDPDSAVVNSATGHQVQKRKEWFI
ncbi:neurexin-4 isoform X2 [Copidosoma floridanum]|nr:neurexin-4 isoform X2 [Copidosoma floridanum]XP_014218967.1 neurexin-4 isoform X2 [Copidosoma floridanum]